MSELVGSFVFFYRGRMLRWVPLILFLLFAVATASRILWHRRATGNSPYVVASGDSPEGYIVKTLRWVMAGLLGALIGHAAGWDGWMGMLPWAQQPATFWLGIILGTGALPWVAVAQAQMGNAWRIGIDHEHATALVHHGLFTISRNPIFLGARFALLGAVLQVPNAVVLATALAAEILIQIQTRLEEAHLSALHGDAYRTYARRVHRWLGRR